MATPPFRRRRRCALAWERQYGRGGFFTYSSQFQWVWLLLTELDIPAGEHVFTLSAVKSGLRIDRIYLTRGKEQIF